jgi:hypothetical protein
VSIFAASSGDEFTALPGAVGTLENRPNHFFVHPRIFTRADKPKTIRSKVLAWGMIKQINDELTNPGTDQEKADILEEQENVEVLFAFLWASNDGLLTPVTLSDMDKSPHLNHQCKLIVNEIRTPTTLQSGVSLDSVSGP